MQERKGPLDEPQTQRATKPVLILMPVLRTELARGDGCKHNNINMGMKKHTEYLNHGFQVLKKSKMIRPC